MQVFFVVVFFLNIIVGFLLINYLYVTGLHCTLTVWVS